MNVKRVLGQNKRESKPQSKWSKCILLISTPVLVILTAYNLYLSLTVGSVLVFAFSLTYFLRIYIDDKKIYWRLLTLFHESCHKVFAKKLGYKAEIVKDKKELEKIQDIKGSYINGFCKFSEEEFKKRDVICIALAPFITMFTLFVLFLFCLQFIMSNLILLFVLGVISFSIFSKLDGCINDLQIVYETVRHYEEGNKIIYSNDEYSFIIYEETI
ncbi:metalloprotease family protein [Bacillus badius]|uniref:metalloprotease family protein n=1 Tax=Bacillus badius TaxID=1455 RepID=UPI000597B394|nr:metalloprotease family protein [Bacillus badius]KIL72529.1 hypothetical protein SD78_4114 [Bacillus badius]